MSEKWTTDTEDQGGVGRGCYVAVLDESRESVAHVRCYDHSLNDLPYRERAHLIASAPELYRELEAAAEIIREHVPDDALGIGGGICPEGGHPDQIWAIKDEVLFHFDRALSKARGETS